MYQLLRNKEDCILEIKKVSKVLSSLPITEKVWEYNDCLYLCSTRKALKEKAIELKEEWIKEAEERLQKVNNIKV